ncbi:MAG TPA: hypothetical protein PLW55_19400, partial [Leptospiraceae bacterium]|nr:hypothetical protein [Leptospiraceae bacterium]
PPFFIGMKKSFLVCAVWVLALSLEGGCIQSPSPSANPDAVILLLFGSVATVRPVQATCNRTNFQCFEYNTGFTGSQMTADCASMFLGVLSASGCPTSSRLGSCYITNRGYATNAFGTTAALRFETPAWAFGTAQGTCSAYGGTFAQN